MTKWLTADPHFNDPNIIAHAKRPFANVEEMNETLIANWNACVKPNDEIFCIGDFARAAGLKDMPVVSAILSRLNGQKWLILGNHDRKRKSIVDNPHWHKVVDYHELKVNMGREHRQKFILFHNACRTWTNSHRGSYMCHGHSHHGLSDIGGKIIDVGVDGHNFKPISVYEVDAYMYHRPITTNDHHKVDNPFTQLPVEELRFLAEQCGKIDHENVVAVDAAWAVRKQIEAALLLHKQTERVALLTPEELQSLYDGNTGPRVVVDMAAITQQAAEQTEATEEANRERDSRTLLP